MSERNFSALQAKVQDYGPLALTRLKQIADDPDTPLKLSADIEKWFAELSLGKAKAALSDQKDAVITLRLEGELAQWAK